MQELPSDARQSLYQSQWWTRLAAFTEDAKRPAMSDTLQFVVIAPEKSVTGNTRQTKEPLAKLSHYGKRHRALVRDDGSG